MRTITVLLAPSLLASAGATEAAPCDAPEFRQFNFWLGEWQVMQPDGALAGTNSIRKEYGGCVLHERYQTAKGYSGESLNAYDVGRKRWHQTWVDNTGTLLLLEGGLRGSEMILEGSTTDAKGVVTRHRITWTPNPDGTVRQHWQSTDATDTWVTAFDGLYSRGSD
jgi:hypothetical protein